MTFKQIDAFLDTNKGKYVRFKQTYLAENLSKVFDANKSMPAHIRIEAGSVGVIYSTRMGTWFIGFGKDSKTPPAKSTSPTSFAATISITVSDCNKIEVEF